MTLRPEYSSNILGRRSFYRLECTICLLYPIRDRYASPKVLFDLRRSAEPPGASLDLRQTPGADLQIILRVLRTFGGLGEPPGMPLYLRRAALLGAFRFTFGLSLLRGTFVCRGNDPQQ